MDTPIQSSLPSAPEFSTSSLDVFDLSTWNTGGSCLLSPQQVTFPLAITSGWGCPLGFSSGKKFLTKPTWEVLQKMDWMGWKADALEVL